MIKTNKWKSIFAATALALLGWYQKPAHGDESSDFLDKQPLYVAQVSAINFITRTTLIKEAYSAQTTLGDVLQRLPKNTVLVLGDGDHSIPDVKYLAGHIISFFAKRGDSVTVYLELPGKDGFEKIDEGYIKEFESSPSISWHAQSNTDLLNFLLKQVNVRAFAVDNNEGWPRRDGEVAFMEEKKRAYYFSIRQEFANTQTEKLEAPCTQSDLKRWAENWDQVYAAIFRKIAMTYDLSPEDLAIFEKSMLKEITYPLAPGWDPVLEASLRMRLEQDVLVAKRIAKEEKMHQGISIVLYGGAHTSRHISPFLSSLAKELPERPVEPLFIANTTRGILEGLVEIINPFLAGFVPNNQPIVNLTEKEALFFFAGVTPSSVPPLVQKQDSTSAPTQPSGQTFRTVPRTALCAEQPTPP